MDENKITEWNENDKKSQFKIRIKLKKVSRNWPINITKWKVKDKKWQINTNKQHTCKICSHVRTTQVILHILYSTNINFFMFDFKLFRSSLHCWDCSLSVSDRFYGKWSLLHTTEWELINQKIMSQFHHYCKIISPLDVFEKMHYVHKKKKLRPFLYYSGKFQ